MLAKIWKQFECPSTSEWINEIGCSSNVAHLSNKNEQTIDTCNDMDGSQTCTKWKKPEIKFCVLYDSIYVILLAKVKLYRHKANHKLLQSTSVGPDQKGSWENFQRCLYFYKTGLWL